MNDPFKEFADALHRRDQEDTPNMKTITKFWSQEVPGANAVILVVTLTYAAFAAASIFIG